jgi:hypothetical protein
MVQRLDIYYKTSSRGQHEIRLEVRYWHQNYKIGVERNPTPY